jgi:hypothetical protein
MTTAGPDGVLTAADLLFGSSENAHEALTRHVMSAGRTMVQTLARLPRVTREAAVREAAVAAAGLLKVDLMEVLVAGWREHRDVFSAARRTLDMPGSKELVGLAPHRITTVQQPSVGILVDGHRVHTLQLGLSVFFEVTGLVAGIHAGRLAGIHAGRGHVGVALTIHELEVLTKRTHLELPGVMALKHGFPPPALPMPGRPGPGRASPRSPAPATRAPIPVPAIPPAPKRITRPRPGGRSPSPAAPSDPFRSASPAVEQVRPPVTADIRAVCAGPATGATPIGRPRRCL